MAGNSLVFEFASAGPADTVVKDALISPCGLYRYWLTREWDPSRHKLPIIMLNPSTADAAIDDPTIRRCIAFAKRDGFGGIRVMNLFAFRATSPDDMKAAADPVGPGNNYLLGQMLERSATMPVVAAWGAHGSFRDRDDCVIALAAECGVRLKCLGKTAGGRPRHPLYVKGDQPFVPFE